MYKYYTTPNEAPVTDTIVTYKQFAHEHGDYHAAPRCKKDYLTYKFWCVANGYTAISSGCRDEEKAYRTCREWSNQQEAEAIDFMLDNST